MRGGRSHGRMCMFSQGLMMNLSPCAFILEKIDMLFGIE